MIHAEYYYYKMGRKCSIYGELEQCI